MRNADLAALCRAPHQCYVCGSADKSIGVVMAGNIGYYQELHRAFTAAW